MCQIIENSLQTGKLRILFSRTTQCVLKTSYYPLNLHTLNNNACLHNKCNAYLNRKQIQRAQRVILHSRIAVSILETVSVFHKDFLREIFREQHEGRLPWHEDSNVIMLFVLFTQIVEHIPETPSHEERKITENKLWFFVRHTPFLPIPIVTSY